MLNKILSFESQKQQLCEFATAEEAEQFNQEFTTNQDQAMELMDKAARFCQAYRFLTPRNSQQYATEFLDQISPFLWETERKKETPTKLRFRVTPSRVDKTQQFLFRFLNQLTGFTRIMSHEEKLVSFDLRTKILNQAAANFASVAAYLANPSKGDGFKSPHEARLRAISMLLVINAMIDDGSGTESVLLSEAGFRSSFISLICKGKSKFVKHIASVVKPRTDPPVSNETEYKVDAKMADALED